MTEALRKSMLYLGPTEWYWRLTDPSAPTAVRVVPPGRWPLDLAPRLRQGHFQHFDAAGLPRVHVRSGSRPVHEYCHIAAFGLAHWDAFVSTGRHGHFDRVLAAVDYIARTANTSGPHGALLRAEVPGQGHVGHANAMQHGEAMSLLVRVWQATRQEQYLDTALALVGPFDMPVERGGFLRSLGPEQIPWFEKLPRDDLSHILNAMVYALWGLHDVAAATGDDRAGRLFLTGAESVERALPLFDCGDWSLYNVARVGPSRIASMMYHNLHICQLTALARMTGRAGLLTYADRFRAYARSPLARARAAGRFVSAIVRDRFKRPLPAPTAGSGRLSPRS